MIKSLKVFSFLFLKNDNVFVLFIHKNQTSKGKDLCRVSVQGVKSLGGHFACLCRGFEFYEVKLKKFCYYFSKRKWKYFYTFNHFCSEKSSKKQNSTNLLL